MTRGSTTPSLIGYPATRVYDPTKYTQYINWLGYASTKYKGSISCCALCIIAGTPQFRGIPYDRTKPTDSPGYPSYKGTQRGRVYDPCIG